MWQGATECVYGEFDRVNEMWSVAAGKVYLGGGDVKQCDKLWRRRWRLQKKLDRMMWVEFEGLQQEEEEPLEYYDWADRRLTELKRATQSGGIRAECDTNERTY